jgi:hypothetical protein
LNAVEIGKKLKYQGQWFTNILTDLLTWGWLKESNSMEKYSITDAGTLAML